MKSIHLDKQQELEMWYALISKLHSVPKNYRSQNHSAFLHELELRVYDLIEELGLRQEDFPFKAEAA